MADWTIQVRVPGPGGAWTTIPQHMDLWYRLEVNAMPQITFGVPNPSVTIANLLIVGNEVRVLDPASVENVRGMIREATNDPILKIQKITAVGKAVRLQDRVWRSRRNFPTVSPSIVLDEIMNSPEGEPSAGLVLRYDMETITSTGLMNDFSVFGNNGTITGTLSTSFKWGNGIAIPNTTDNISVPASASINITGSITITMFVSQYDDGSSDIMTIWNKLSGNNGISLTLNPGTKVMTLTTGNGTTTTNFTSGAIPTTGTPAFIAVVVNGTTSGNFYYAISGGSVTSNGTFTPVTRTDSGGAATVGKLNVKTGANKGFDELHVYNRALTTSELAQLAGVGVLEGGLGTISASLPTAPPRIEGDRRLQVIDSYTRALGAEWYVDQNASDQDRLNIISRVGSSTSTQTFQLSKNCSLGSRQLNNDTIFNDITVFGVGDGQLQLQSRNFSATTLRTTTTAVVTATQTTSIAVVSTTGFSTNGVIFIGMERIQYTGIDATHIGTTSIVRAYQGDGIASYPAYQHNSGIEIYLSFDGTNYWTANNAQSGSQIFINGLRSGIYTDKTIIDQNTLDFLAYNLNIRYNNPREALQITVPTNDLTAVLGDAVTVNDSAGNPFASTPYRIIGMEWDWDSKSFRLELLPNTTPHASGGYIDSPSRAANRTAESTSDLETYGVINDISVSSYNTANITVTTNTEKITISLVLSGVKNGTKLVFLGAITITTGTATTDLLINLRRGNLITSPLVGTNQGSHITAAGSNYTINGQWTDTAYQDNPIYSISVQQISATGNGTVFSTCLWVENSE